MSTSTVSITEPAKYTLDQLFKSSDIVASVKVLSGDTENYQVAIYKAEVVTSFKGTKAGATLYFGPYFGVKLGTETMLFLRQAKIPAVPKDNSHSPYGTISYLEIFNEGYSHMDVSYECLFDGASIDQNCDYGVRVCTDYIVLPPKTPTSPPKKEETDFGCRWVRRSKFEAILNSLAEPAIQ